MDELEHPIHGHKLALIEVVAHVDRKHILGGMEAIGTGLLDKIAADERVIRLKAIRLLEDAMRRYDPPATGMHWPG